MGAGPSSPQLLALSLEGSEEVQCALESALRVAQKQQVKAFGVARRNMPCTALGRKADGSTRGLLRWSIVRFTEGFDTFDLGRKTMLEGWRIEGAHHRKIAMRRPSTGIREFG
jgi:hypothetical protein